MKKTEWVELTEAEQDALATEYGITRSGENNNIVNESELTKIPETKQDVKPEKEVKKPVVKEAPKRSPRRRTSKKSKRRSSK